MVFLVSAILMEYSDFSEVSLDSNDNSNYQSCANSSDLDSNSAWNNSPAGLQFDSCIVPSPSPSPRDSAPSERDRGDQLTIDASSLHPSDLIEDPRYDKFDEDLQQDVNKDPVKVDYVKTRAAPNVPVATSSSSSSSTTCSTTDSTCCDLQPLPSTHEPFHNSDIHLPVEKWPNVCQQIDCDSNTVHAAVTPPPLGRSNSEPKPDISFSVSETGISVTRPTLHKKHSIDDLLFELYDKHGG